MAPEFRVAFDWEGDGTWHDETRYVEALRIAVGFAAPEDPVAEPGVCVVTLDNASRRFSPGWTAGPLAQALLPGRAMRVQAVEAGMTWTLFRGVIARITPEAGPYGSRRVTITGEDGLAALLRTRVGVVHQATINAAEAVAAIVNRAGAPVAGAYADNGDVLTHYGRTWHPEETRCWDALQAIALAVYGRFFVARNGTATFLSRAQMQDPSVEPALVVDDDPVADVALGVDASRVINAAQVIVHPVETVGVAGDLWTAHTVLHLAPGETRVLAASFRDERGERCGAVNVVAPVAGTDYHVNERADGTGFDYTTSPSFGLSAAVEATRAVLTLTNQALGSLYVTRLRVRGQPLVAYDPIVIERSDVASQMTFQARSRTLDLPLQADPVFGEALANTLVARRSMPELGATSITFRNRVLPGEASIFGAGLLDKVRVSDSHSGLDRADYRVHGLTYAVDGRGWEVVLRLEAADTLAGWLLDRSDYSVLGVHTRLGL